MDSQKITFGEGAGQRRGVGYGEGEGRASRGEHDVSPRGDQGLRMKGTAASSSVFGRLRAAVGAIVDMLICIRLAGAPEGGAGGQE